MDFRRELGDILMVLWDALHKTRKGGKWDAVHRIPKGGKWDALHRVPKGGKMGCPAQDP